MASKENITINRQEYDPYRSSNDAFGNFTQSSVQALMSMLAASKDNPYAAAQLLAHNKLIRPGQSLRTASQSAMIGDELIGMDQQLLDRMMGGGNDPYTLRMRGDERGSSHARGSGGGGGGQAYGNVNLDQQNSGGFRYDDNEQRRKQQRISPRGETPGQGGGDGLNDIRSAVKAAMMRYLKIQKPHLVSSLGGAGGVR